MNEREQIPGLDLGYGTENPALDDAFAVIETAQVGAAKRGRQIIVGPAKEIGEGEKRIIEIERFSIGVFNIKGEFFALKNNCPHAGAPLCQGKIQTTHRPSKVGEYDPAYEGRIIRCPWHGWEFDIVTGKGLYDRTSRVATYPCHVDEEGNVVVTI